MDEKILFKDEIILSLTSLSNDKKEVSWPDLLKDMKEFIVDQYDGKSLIREKGDWKRRLKLVAKSLGLKFIRFNEDAWQDIQNALATSNVHNKSSTKSNSSNYRLSESEKNRILSNYNSIAKEDQWILSTGTIVDLKMKALAEASIYEHPVHSMIIDPDDQVWIDYFTLEELNEIKSFNVKLLKSIPKELESYLDLYNKKWETGLDLYEFADSKRHHPIKEFEKKWVRESMIGVSELFFYQQDLMLNDCSESDLLHQLRRFVYRQFGDCSSKAMLGERCSIAVAIARNSDRALEGKEKRTRKIMGAKLDILFKNGSDELGSCEVGKDCVVVVDDKYLDDGLVKLPKTLRDMLSALVEKNLAKINQLSTIGFLMMGLEMELVRMDIPKGKTIARVIKTPRFTFPSCSESIYVDFIPLLEIAWKGKQAMLETVALLNDRKRKATEFSMVVNNSVILPQSFNRSS